MFSSSARPPIVRPWSPSAEAIWTAAWRISSRVLAPRDSLFCCFRISLTAFIDLLWLARSFALYYTNGRAVNRRKSVSGSGFVSRFSVHRLAFRVRVLLIWTDSFFTLNRKPETQKLVDCNSDFASVPKRSVLYGRSSVAAPSYITLIAARRGGHGGPPVQDY